MSGQANNFTLTKHYFGTLHYTGVNILLVGLESN